MDVPMIPIGRKSATLLCILFALLVTTRFDQAAAARPNILFCLSDDQSFPHASILGDPVVQTPAFDRVAREGALFMHSYSAGPSCTPSRTAILTGRQIWQVGEGGVLFGTLDPQYPLVTHQFEDAGYHVGYVGKPWAPGDWQAAGLTRHPNGKEYAKRLEPNPPLGIDTRDYAGNFTDFLNDCPNDAPFFFWFGCTEPHREYDEGIGQRSGLNPERILVPPYLPDSPETRSEMLDYYYEIQHFDRHIAEMLQELEKRDQLENTIVVITSDNGMPFTRTKTTLYDGGVRMPTAIRWGAKVPADQRIQHFISHIDLAPTFLEAAGIPIPHTVTGKSFLKLITTPSFDGTFGKRDHVITALERHTYCRPNGATYPIRAIRTHDFLYLRNFKPDRWPTGGPTFISSNKAPHGDIDDGPFKDYVFRPEVREQFPIPFGLTVDKRPLEELYDLKADPHQLNNIAHRSANQSTKKQLWSKLRQHLEMTNDPRLRGEDPWQKYIYRQTEGFGATYNFSLSEAERTAALNRAKHQVSPGAKE